LHLNRLLLGAHYLTATEKLRIAYGLGRLVLASASVDPPLHEWLSKHGQTENTIRKFWAVVFVSALNERVEHLGLKYARKVVMDGFIRHRDAYTVHIPRVPLVKLYGEELAAYLRRWKVQVKLESAVRTVESTSVRLRNGDSHDFDAVVLAVPFERVPGLLPDNGDGVPQVRQLKRLAHSPITSVHVWTASPVMEIPHTVLIDGLGDWVFNRGATEHGEYLIQVVISASTEATAQGQDALCERILSELQRLYPRLRTHPPVRTKVITEQRATFRATPGVDAHRPTQQTASPGLFLAGDYTLTGWPATMEGAVRSGNLCAAAIARSLITATASS